jgi:triacylglycerol lipase
MKHFAVCLMAICLVLGLSPMHAANESAAADYPKVPILMVHGLGGSSSGWTTMETKLKSAGYPAELLFTVDVADNSTMCATSHITDIHDAIESIVAQTGYTQVDVIGHSRGGTDLYSYMRYSNGANRVRNWISLAGANNYNCNSTYGTPPADPTLGAQTLYTSIYSPDDGLVPESWSIIQGANNIEVAGVSHLQFPTSATVFPYVLNALQGTGLNDGVGLLALPSAPSNLTLANSN